FFLSESWEVRIISTLYIAEADTSFYITLRQMLGIPEDPDPVLDAVNIVVMLSNYTPSDLYRIFKSLQLQYPESFANFSNLVMGDYLNHVEQPLYGYQLLDVGSLVTKYGDRNALNNLYEEMEDDAHMVLLGLAS